MSFRRPMPALTRFGFLVFAAVAGSIVLAASGPSAGQAPPPPEVDVASVVSKPVRQWDQFTGRIAAIEAVEIRARVSGYLSRVAFKEGDEVKEGDLLFVIDRRPYKAALDSVAAQLERAKATARLADILDQRSQQLIKTGAISRNEFDRNSTSLAQANAEVSAAEAALETARLNLDYTEVRSPIAGKVSRTMLTQGNLIQADQTVLTSVVSQDPVYVYFQPDEQTFQRYGDMARKGERAASANSVRVGLAGDEGHPHEGTVNFVNNQVDSTTGTITMRAVVPNLDRVFVPGMYARVQLEGSGEFKAMLIDEKAVMTDQDRKYVYVLGPESKAMRKNIVLGGAIEGLRVVQSGLDPRDKVIVAGLQKIFAPGMPVKPSEVPMVKPSKAVTVDTKVGGD
ncbi:efflux RND transporter periplasmic adaptor subunit [Reyranella sp.]|uniref:efflux RND transporter periplasmic adaptor subunit n=1 Tax=Reyranella sp. TaxID=1929291 RepID=UPI0025FE320E|nr:efflux RND transporter periplasmic adaptor subunit [Reyranella sp.]